jgi:fructose-1,6-bisphosphatase/inositol monophosphatase family enzyme
MMNPDLEQFGIGALREAHMTFLRLVRDGSARRDVGRNQFGEMAMQIDIASEEAVITHLRMYAGKIKQGIRVVSEEHGEFVIGGKPVLTAFLDGFDGSSAFRDSKGKARGGTMFALYKGTDPRFQDYLFGGIVDHMLEELVVAVKGAGTLLVTGSNTAAARVSDTKTLDASTRIDIDEGVKNYPTFPAHAQGYFYDPIKKSFKTRYVGSSAVYFFDLAVGNTDVVLEYGRKNNLEHMVAYPLVVESGGVMEFVAGRDLGPTRYSDYCAMDGGYPAIIAAATSALADAVRRSCKL